METPSVGELGEVKSKKTTLGSRVPREEDTATLSSLSCLDLWRRNGYMREMFDGAYGVFQPQMATTGLDVRNLETRV